MATKINPQTISGKISGKISFDELEFSEFYSEEVKPNNQTSGKIHFSPNLIGKTIYVLIPKEKKK